MGDGFVARFTFERKDIQRREARAVLKAGQQADIQELLV